ncbi:unnamed protein product, partial [Angiostrongylus costaricensis]|uniref:Agrin n=1 Tax=Angiostrongylus costaricensis TaxID=334426 RepID=A0A0R3PF93_ANGCS
HITVQTISVRRINAGLFLDGCEKKNCQYYATCISENGKAECRCATECNSNLAFTKPVCGTDGVTYSSECHLKNSACQQTKFIVVAFEGKCDACTNVECGFGEECRRGECVCSYQCSSAPPPSARVCAEDGVLYASDCHRQLAACRRRSPIAVMPLTHCHSAVSALNDDCQCHSLGSLEPKCDIDGNCRCRAGVGGAKCDHCLPGFWGLHLIALGQQSCQPCGCSAFGSSRADCEQSTGRCECWRGARGERCERCTTDLVMTASGCVPKQEYRTPASCSSLECHHGAKCVQSVGELPDCECPEHCDMNHLGIVANMSVCGSDGTTYEDMCQLLKFACKHQLDLVAVSLGICFQGPKVSLVKIIFRLNLIAHLLPKIREHTQLPRENSSVQFVGILYDVFIKNAVVEHFLGYINDKKPTSSCYLV